MGCGKGRFHTKPSSHYTLPSGDKIPSVALGESALQSTTWFIDVTALYPRQASGKPAEEKLDKL